MSAEALGRGEPTQLSELRGGAPMQALAALASVNIGVETSIDPSIGAKTPVHDALMRNLGVLFLEVLDLEGLAADCADDGQHSFLYVAVP